MFGNIIETIRRLINPLEYYKSKGVTIGENCRFIGDVSLGSEPYLVTIGNHVSISNSKIITHDGGVWVFRDDNPKIDFFAPVQIGNNVFIGEGCSILPGTTIGDNVVVGAGAVVRGELESDMVYAGVPARPIKAINEYWEKISPLVVQTKRMTKKEKKKFLVDKYMLS